MTVTTIGLAFAATAAVAVATGVAAQSPAVTGAVLVIEPRTVRVTLVDVTNVGAVPIERLTLEYQSPSQSGHTTRHFNDDPLMPGRPTRLTIPSNPDDTSVHVALLVFADGRVEGQPALVEAERQQAAALATDLAAWLDVFDRLPRSPQHEAFAALREAAAVRRRDASDDPSGIRRTVERWMSAPRLPSFTFTEVDQEQKQLRPRLEAARRKAQSAFDQTNRPALLTREASAAVTIRAKPDELTEHIVYVENRRSSALEAWEVTETAAGQHQPRSGVFHQTTVAGGPVAPGARHRARTITMTDSTVPVPTVALAFGYWSDRMWEGSRERHDDLLKQRDDLAREYSDWITTLTEAEAMAPGAAVAFLRRKAAEPGQRESTFRSNLPQVERIAASSPSQLPALLQTYRRFFERELPLLTRHRQH